MQRKFLILNVLFISFLGLTACSSEDEPSLEGNLIPFIKAQNMMGETLRIRPHGFDKPALVNIWATWCKPCIIEMPSLEAVAKKGDYRVIAISNDANKSVVKEFVENGEYKYIEFLYDPFGRQSRQIFQASGLPMTLLIDHNAIVQHIFLGEEDWQSPEVQKILNKYKVQYDD